LPLAQDQIRCRGHAVEARLYAEDATRDFLPQTGRLTHLRWPDDLRVDSAVRAGDSVSRHYDPMLAKLIAWGEDRDTALGRLGRGLAATEIVGVTTNRAFLQALLAHPEFVARAPDTGFIPRHAAELQVAPIADRRLLALAVLALLRQGERRQRRAADPADPHSPWGQATGWRLSGAAQVVLRLNDEPVAVTYAADGYDLALAPGSCFIAGDCAADGTLSARFEGETLSGRAIFGDARLTLFCQGRQAEFQLADPLAPRDQADPGGGLVAPMPGQVTRLFVAIGDQVDKGAPLMVLEAMKMEHTILAPHRGRVVELAFAVGDSVPERAVLARLESQAAVTAAAASP
jgi:3-methylcrotonyl-CoA carboxylase alpha subunit